jgi:hypothetical protein
MAKEEYELNINDDGDVEINGILIDNETFDEDKIGYTVREREELIDDLMMWISECKQIGMT